MGVRRVVIDGDKPKTNRQRVADLLHRPDDLELGPDAAATADDLAAYRAVAPTDPAPVDLELNEDERAEDEWLREQDYAAFDADTDPYAKTPDPEDQWEDEPRDFDLGVCAGGTTNGSRRPPRTYTQAELRVQNEWVEVARDADETPAAHRAQVAEELGIPAAGFGRVAREDRSREAGTRWLRSNDPALTAEGVRREVEAVTLAHGVEPTQYPQAFKNGRPSASGRELRATLRVALLPMWESGRNRDLMARALGCSRPALNTLMA